MLNDNSVLTVIAVLGIIGAVWLFMVDVDHRDAALACKDAGGIFFNPSLDQVCLHPSSVIKLEKEHKLRLIRNGSAALSR